MSSSGKVIAPIVVTSHTTTVVANQDAVPSIVSPCVNTDARINATIVNAKPVPPRSSDAYPWGNFKIDKDRIACVTTNTDTAKMKHGTDNETPGTIQPATSSPIAHDARSTNPRSRICLVTTAKPTARRMNRRRHRERVVAVVLVLMPVRVWFATGVGAPGAD